MEFSSLFIVSIKGRWFFILTATFSVESLITLASAYYFSLGNIEESAEAFFILNPFNSDARFQSFNPNSRIRIFLYVEMKCWSRSKMFRKSNLNDWVWYRSEFEGATNFLKMVVLHLSNKHASEINSIVSVIDPVASLSLFFHKRKKTTNRIFPDFGFIFIYLYCLCHNVNQSLIPDLQSRRIFIKNGSNFEYIKLKKNMSIKCVCCEIDFSEKQK